MAITLWQPTLGTVASLLKGRLHRTVSGQAIVDPRVDPDAPEDRYIAFPTSATRIDVGEYSKRWTIETCYRPAENVRTKTLGSNGPVWLFCFLYSLVLLNAWVLINAQLVGFLKLRGRVLPVPQLYMKTATLMVIYQKIMILHEPSLDTI